MDDHLAILRLMADYCYYTDINDSRAWADCFTDDAVWEGGIFGRFEGGKEGAYAYHAPAGDGTFDYRHINTNHRIDQDGDRATVTSHMQVYDQRGEVPVLIFSGLYDDLVEKQNGKWLIRKRILVFDTRHFRNKVLAEA